MKNKFYSIYKIPYNNIGQSLFEVIVAIGIAGLVLVGAVSLSTASVRNSVFSRNDSVATKFAQEGSEWLREQRDGNTWDDFMSNIVTTKVCLSATFDLNDCTINSLYSRNIKFECQIYDPGNPPGIPSSTSGIVNCNLSGVNIVNSYVIVSWTDGNGIHEVRDVTTLSRWK